MPVVTLSLTGLVLGNRDICLALNPAISGTPREAKALLDKPWTTEDIRIIYEQVKKSPTDVKPFLKSKTGRRYIDLGGSGMVGSWIAQHLLWRGENPAAIRILDLQAPMRPEVAENDTQFFATDVTDKASLKAAFDAPWPADVASSPLTVFH